MIIKFHGQYAHFANNKQVNIILKNRTTVKDLLNLLVSRYPRFLEVLPLDSPESWCDHMLVIDNCKVCKINDYVSEDSSIIIAPPLSGG